MAALFGDVRYALRLLVRQPTFTAVAVFVLAVGIGANAAVFSLVNALLLKPRPGQGDGALVGLYSRDRTRPDVYRAFSYPNFADLAARTDVFASVTAHGFALAGLSDGDATRRVFTSTVPANFFATFGVTLPLGRPFTAEEERPGADIPVAILSHGAWRRLGGTAGVLHRRIRLNGREFTVVGVAPEGFGGSMVFVTPELWVPTGVYDAITNDFMRDGLAANLADRRHHNLILVARLHPGATIDSVAPALEAVSAQMEAAHPAENAGQSLVAAPLARLSVSTRPTDDRMLTGVTTAFLAMAAVVLLVASFNLANMLLARGGARRREMAVRLAIGGGRGRLVRQLLTENAVLAIGGGALGLLLAAWATRLLVASIASIAPVSIAFDATPDARVLGATLAYAMAGTIVFGLFPAWKLARTDVVPELKDPAGAAGRRGRMGAQNVFVMGQLALSLVLLASAGLFLRGATAAASADPGFSFDRGIVAQIDPGLAGRDAARARAIHRDALARVRGRPDVAAAGLASLIPFGDVRDGVSVQRPGAPLRRGDPGAEAGLVPATFTRVSAGYFDALGLALAAGRDFTAAEESAGGGPRVAIVDAAAARRLFGGANPVGQSIQFSPREVAAPPVVLEVVGVAPALRDDLFEREPEPHVYVPLGQDFQTGVFLHVRTGAATPEAEAALLPALRRDLLAVDPGLPILTLETRAMFRDRNAILAFLRAGALIFAVFGAVALALAAVGVYGVKAYLVARRTREFGIRLALGATPSRIVRSVVGDGLATTGIGLGAGLALAFAASLGLRGLTYQGAAADLLLLGAAFAVLAAAAGLAAWIPAWRATRLPPSRALRAE